MRLVKNDDVMLHIGRSVESFEMWKILETDTKKRWKTLFSSLMLRFENFKIRNNFRWNIIISVKR